MSAGVAHQLLNPCGQWTRQARQNGLRSLAWNQREQIGGVVGIERQEDLLELVNRQVLNDLLARGRRDQAQDGWRHVRSEHAKHLALDLDALDDVDELGDVGRMQGPTASLRS